MKSGRNKLLEIAIWASTLPALLAACFFYYPLAFTGPVLCPLPLMLGLPCPGCGLTRALACATHGHWSEAYAFHPLWPLLLAYFGLISAWRVHELVRGRPPRLDGARVSFYAAVALSTFYVLRLVVFFAHGGLAVMWEDNVVARVLRLLS